MNETMHDNAFEQILDRYGADPTRWPPTARAEVAALLERSVRARRLLAEAERLDEALDGALAALPAPLGLKTRILANLVHRASWLEWLAVRAWRPVGLACLPLALGFAVGLNFADDTVDVEAHLLLALSETELADFEIPGGPQ